MHRRSLIDVLTKSAALFSSGQAPGSNPGALPSLPKPISTSAVPKPVSTPAVPKPVTTPPVSTVEQHSQPSAPPSEWSTLTGTLGMIPGMKSVMPPQSEQAEQWYNQVKDPNTNWMNSQKWEAANNLKSWLEQNQSHPTVSAIRNLPQVQQNLAQLNSPLGQVGQRVVPILNRFTQTPEQFAQFINLPVIRELFKGTIGQTGIPGLALAHSFMSGNMGNWNALTAGLRDPHQRYAGRNFYNELGQLFNKQGAYISKKKGPDVIDKYIARAHCANIR